MEIKLILWETFMHTGDIDTYLLYKSADTDTCAKDEKGIEVREEERVWRTSQPKA